MKPNLENIPEPGYQINEVASIVRKMYGTKTTGEGILYLLQKGKIKEGEHYLSVGRKRAKRRSIKITRDGLERIIMYYDLKHSKNN